MGQLVVTPEIVASKINNMKDSKSPGVDGITPKMLHGTVEQLSMPLAHVLNMSLQGDCSFGMKRSKHFLFIKKKVSRNKSVNYRPVSLTAVICKVI